MSAYDGRWLQQLTRYKWDTILFYLSIVAVAYVEDGGSDVVGFILTALEVLQANC